MRNHSNENEFDLHENGHVGETHFHMNGFAPRLVLKQRQRLTRKWPNNCLHAARIKHASFISIIPVMTKKK